MNKYIQDWLDVIEYMNNDNTYKLAWGRAILENVYTLNHIEENNVITFDAIAHKHLLDSLSKSSVIDWVDKHKEETKAWLYIYNKK